MIDLINKAKQFSKKAHEGQIRKGDGSPYFTHPETVYKIAKDVTNDINILAACYLHDTIEDTPTTYEELVKAFNKEIADIVLAVSEDKEDKDWHSRKSKYLKSVFSNEKAVIVAWADKMHNTTSLLDVKDFKVFNSSLKDKIAFYSKFAKKLPQGEMRERLELVLDIVCDIVYYISE